MMRKAHALGMILIVIQGLGCNSHSAPHSPDPSPAEERPSSIAAIPTARPANPTPPGAEKRPAVTVEPWYTPIEQDFQASYQADAANQKRQTWKEYWSWVQTFYSGNLFTTGWTGQSKRALAAVTNAEASNALRQQLNALGRRIGAEWAKDNGVRRISTRDLSAFGDRLLRVQKQDDGSGQKVVAEVERIAAEVATRLR